MVSKSLFANSSVHGCIESHKHQTNVLGTVRQHFANTVRLELFANTSSTLFANTSPTLFAWNCSPTLRQHCSLGTVHIGHNCSRREPASTLASSQRSLLAARFRLICLVFAALDESMFTRSSRTERLTVWLSPEWTLFAVC